MEFPDRIAQLGCKLGLDGAVYVNTRVEGTRDLDRARRCVLRHLTRLILSRQSGFADTTGERSSAEECPAMHGFASAEWRTLSASRLW